MTVSDETDGAAPKVFELVPFDEGFEYAYHYGEAGADEPIIRFDNHHGVHELHLGGETFEIDYPGLAEIFRTWRAALPEEKRDDW